MSKLSFRARQVDYTKPLPIYLNHDLPDLQDFAAINRSVPLMPTGMEKDEEAEHHLQRALSALQAFGATSSNEYAIPTPKVEIDNKMYERIYNIECPKQKQYIRIQPFSNDYDYPDYDADYEDENWLNEKKKTLPKDFNQDLLLYFETIMDRLEKVTSHSTILMSRDEAKLVLMKEAGNDDNINDSSSLNKQQKHKEELEEFLLSIYEYWKSKRLSCNHPLTPIVLTDKSGVVTQQNNPYLVFRRRTEKMQTRKNRKNEEQSYEKMLILKRDLCRAQHILKLIKKRENFKKEFLKLTLETFEKRYKLNDFDGSLTDSIACSLKPLLLNNTSQTTAYIINSQQQPNTLNNLLNNSNKHGHNYNSQTNDINKNLSSIDKTIVNLINSNKLRTLGSPPHSSLKKLPQIEKDFMVDNIYKTSNSLNLKLTKQQQQLLSEKQQKRLKKEKLQQHQSTGINQNTISNLINNRKLYGEYEDLSTNNKSESNYNKITVNNNPNAAPLTNRSNNNIFNNNNIKRRNNILNNHKRSLNNTNSNSNSSSDSNNNNNNSNNRYLTNENENLDSNNNKHSRNLNLNHHLYKNGDLINTNNNNNRLVGNSNNSNDNNNNNNNEDENSINNLNIIFNEFKEYEEELRQNQIENLDSILNEAKNRLSTTSDKDGYWCFKRKEGCKYLPQNGPIFKNDVLEMEEFLKPLPPPSLHYQASVIGQQQQLLSLNSVIDLTNSSNNNNTDEIVNNNHFYQLSQQNKKHKRLEFKKKDRLKELQQFYYGYAITKHNRHLGLVRRRLGRGGRILLDKFNENLIDLKSSKNSVDYLTTITIKKSNELKICPLNLSKFKTYYPIECYNLNNETNNNDLQQQQNIENKDKKTKITSNEQTLKKPESTSSMPPPPASSSSVPKLKLKNFYDNELPSDITDYNQNCNDNLSKNFLDIDDDDFMFDHRLFSLYQFENENDNKFLNELTTDGDSNVNLEKKEDEEDVTMKSNHERKESGSSSTSSFVNLINENNNNDYEDLDFKDNDYNNNNDDDDDFELIEYDECKNFKMNSELINNKVYDRTNLIRFDFSSMTKLNDEYHSSSNECRLNLSNVKQAITTLKIPPKITTIPTQINDFINIDFKNNDEFILKETNNESNDCIKIKDDDKLDEKKQSDQKLGESIANITSTTLTPPSPSPPLMNISSPSKSEEILNIIKTTTVTPVPVPVPSIIIENKTNDINEQINNHFNASIANNKLLVSLPTTIMNPNNNITNNINNQTQSGRFLQSLNKIKNLNYSNDKIMQPLVNGTNNVITVSSTTIPNNNNNALLSTSTSTSSSPSSSSSSSLSQTYLVKKQINNNNNNNSINSITKSSSLFYSTTSPSSLPSSSSTSSSSSSSNIIINTPSTKLTNSSSPNLISLTGTIQQNNTNQIINSNNNSNNTNTIIVNGVLAKKKDENNPYLLNNNNFQNFHHIQQQQHQENQITSTTQTTNTVINANSNSLTNGILPTQKLFQAIQFSTNSLPAGIINNNSNNSNSNNNNNTNSNNLMNLMSNSSHHHHSNLFKTTSNSTSIINSPLQVPIALSSSHSSNSNSNNNNDLNSSTKII